MAPARSCDRKPGKFVNALWRLLVLVPRSAPTLLGGGGGGLWYDIRCAPKDGRDASSTPALAGALLAVRPSRRSTQLPPLRCISAPWQALRKTQRTCNASKGKRAERDTLPAVRPRTRALGAAADTRVAAAAAAACRKPGSWKWSSRRCSTRSAAKKSPSWALRSRKTPATRARRPQSTSAAASWRTAPTARSLTPRCLRSRCAGGGAVMARFRGSGRDQKRGGGWGRGGGGLPPVAS